MQEEYGMRLSALEERLGYAFHDRGLLEAALTHTSFVKGDGRSATHNERLEFLGDAVLELCVSEYLYTHYPKLDEGRMTRARAATVCESALFDAAARLGIPEALRLGHGEERTGGRDKPSIVSDAYEAVIGAIFLDGGIGAAKAFVLRNQEEVLKTAAKGRQEKDYKTALQEYVQKRHLGQIQYRLAGEKGPDHRKEFHMELLLRGVVLSEGIGGSKQEAGQRAAEAALSLLNERE